MLFKPILKITLHESDFKVDLLSMIISVKSILLITRDFIHFEDQTFHSQVKVLETC